MWLSEWSTTQTKNNCQKAYKMNQELRWSKSIKKMYKAHQWTWPFYVTSSHAGYICVHVYIHKKKANRDKMNSLVWVETCPAFGTFLLLTMLVSSNSCLKCSFFFLASASTWSLNSFSFSSLSSSDADSQRWSFRRLRRVSDHVASEDRTWGMNERKTRLSCDRDNIPAFLKCSESALKYPIWSFLHPINFSYHS